MVTGKAGGVSVTVTVVTSPQAMMFMSDPFEAKDWLIAENLQIVAIEETSGAGTAMATGRKIITAHSNDRVSMFS